MINFKQSQRKFILACFFSINCTVGFFLGLMEAGTYVAVVTLIMGLYETGNLVERKINSKLPDQI